MAKKERKKPLLTAVLQGKCPACRKGNLFIAKNPFNLKKLGEVHDHCSNCGQRFSPEPGFYFGAAYVSYAINVALFIAISIAVTVLVEDPGIATYVTPIIIATIVLAPIIYRLSRVIWATMFIPYGGEKKEGSKHED